MKLLPAISKLEIVTKELETPKLGEVMNWQQRHCVQTVEYQLSQGKPARIIVLKARQLGLSTVIEAMMFIMAMLIPRLKGLVVAHEIDSAEHLLSMTQHYWESFEFKPLYREKYRGAKRLAWHDIESFLRIATANNAKAGRSQTIQYLHASEVAFYTHTKELMTGLLQAVPKKPGTVVALESTANGVGNWFHQQWLMAESGQSDYIPLFYPWWKHPEYVWPVFGVLDPLDEEERILKAIFKIANMDEGEIYQRLNWRRYMIRNDLANDVEMFHQEYPSNPEEAFLSTGRNVFPPRHIKECYQPMQGKVGRLVHEGSQLRFQLDISGPLTIYKMPADNDWGQYVIAGDPTRTTEGDYAVAQVLNRRTWEQVAVFRQRLDPNTFGERLAELGKYYNHGLVNTEIEGPGYSTIAVLLQMNYPFVWQRQIGDQLPGTFTTRWGWSSTNKTKPEAVGNLLKVIVDHDIIIHDEQTFHELINFVDLGGGQYGNSIEGEHDDCVMSLAIGMTTVLYEAASLAAYGVSGQENLQAPVPDWMNWEQQTA